MIDIVELRNADYLEYQLKQDETKEHKWQLYCHNKLSDENVIIQRGITIKDISKFSDGYHSFEELYEFRKLYNAALFNSWYNTDSGIEVYKSKRHFDGEECFGGGWFIVVAILPNGKQISNHYELKDWDLFKIPECEKSKYEFDGHTPQDVLERLNEIL